MRGVSQLGGPPPPHEVPIRLEPRFPIFPNLFPQLLQTLGGKSGASSAKTTLLPLKSPESQIALLTSSGTSQLQNAPFSLEASDAKTVWGHLRKQV